MKKFEINSMKKNGKILDRNENVDRPIVDLSIGEERKDENKEKIVRLSDLFRSIEEKSCDENKMKKNESADEKCFVEINEEHKSVNPRNEKEKPRNKRLNFLGANEKRTKNRIINDKTVKNTEENDSIR